jgi:hypothetical protein
MRMKISIGRVTGYITAALCETQAPLSLESRMRYQQDWGIENANSWQACSTVLTEANSQLVCTDMSSVKLTSRLHRYRPTETGVK